MAKFPLELLEGPYLRDILDQPSAMAETVASLKRESGLDSLRQGLLKGQWRRVVMTGMGGSHAILAPLHIRLVQAGLECLVADTSELLYSTPRLLESDTVIVAVSQSGASVETARMLGCHKGAFVVGVTNTEGSPLDRQADLVIRTKAGDESAVACKTAVTAMAVLHWIGEHLCGACLNQARKDLEQLAPAMAAYLACWQSHVRTLAGKLDGAHSILFAGRGRSLAGAMMGGMILKETAGVHGEGMGSAALRHGPFEMLSPEVFVLVFAGDRDVNALNSHLVQDARAAGARAALCGFAGEGPFVLPPVPESVRPVIELLPAQMISLALAGLRGRAAAVFERISKVTTAE